MRRLPGAGEAEAARRRRRAGAALLAAALALAAAAPGARAGGEEGWQAIAIGPVEISYPRGWAVALSPSGRIVVAPVLAPSGRARPYLVIEVLRPAVREADLMARAQAVIPRAGDGLAWTLLGRQRLGRDREAAFYVVTPPQGARERQGGRDARLYVMVGAVQGAHASAVMVGTDPVGDPGLAATARTLEAMMARIKVA